MYSSSPPAPATTITRRLLVELKSRANTNVLDKTIVNRHNRKTLMATNASFASTILQLITTLRQQTSTADATMEFETNPLQAIV